MTRLYQLNTLPVSYFLYAIHSQSPTLIARFALFFPTFTMANNIMPTIHSDDESASRNLQGRFEHLMNVQQHRIR